MKAPDTRRGWLDADAAAAMLGCTPAELLERAGEGLISGSVLSRAGWHFRRKDLEQQVQRDAGALAQAPTA